MSTRTRRHTLQLTASRHRLLARAIRVLEHALADATDAHEPTDGLLETFAHRLAEHGIAATPGALDRIVEDRAALAAIRLDPARVEDHLDLTRFYGTRDDAVAWLDERLERNLTRAARSLCG